MTTIVGVNDNIDHPTWQGNSTYEETIKTIFNNYSTGLTVGKTVGISNYTLVETDEIFIPLHGFCRVLRNYSPKEELWISFGSSLNVMIVKSSTRSSFNVNLDFDSSLQLRVGAASEEIYYNVLTTVYDSRINVEESCTDYTELDYTYEECVDQEYKDIILKWFHCLPPWVTDVVHSFVIGICRQKEEQN